MMAAEEGENLGMDVVLVSYMQKKFNFLFESIKKLSLENYCERIQKKMG